MDLFNLSAKLTLDKSEYESGLNDAESQAQRGGSKIGSLLKGVGITAAAGVTAAGAALVKLTQSAVGAYANYQQLVGGVETIFGTGGQNLRQYAAAVGKTVYQAKEGFDRLKGAQELVMKNAEQAFRTSGLSMNDYMEQVTSFSASLIQSLDGDTVAAAKAADRAIIDMSDNANKMGTDMGMIQNAYNGFAKQNYTMLDNLKLGYGGTKEEMKRLIEDASKMTDVQEELGLTVDKSSMSFGNIVNAISVMQKSMGIAGTTSKEASSTVSGSMGQMRAAWQNVVTSFALGGDQLQQSISDWLETAKAMVANMIPTIKAALGGIGDFMKSTVPQLLKEVPALVKEILPSFANAVGGMFSNLGKSVRIGIKGVFKIARGLLKSFAGQESGKNGFGGILGSVSKLGKRIFTAISKIFKTLFKQIGKLITDVDWMAVGNKVMELLGNGFNAAMDIMVNAFRGLMNLIGRIDWLSVGKTIVGWIKAAFNGLTTWFWTAFSEVSAVIKRIDWKKVGTFIVDTLKSALGSVVSFFTNIFNNSANAISSIDWKRVGWQIWFRISDAFKNVTSWFKGLFTKSKDGVQNGIDWAGLGSSILNLITSAFGALYDVFSKLFYKAKKAIEDINWEEVGTTVKDMILTGLQKIVEFFTNLYTDASEAIRSVDWKDVGQKIWDFISSAFSGVVEWFKSLFTDAGDETKSGIDWAGLGKAILDFIVSAFTAIGDTFTTIFMNAWNAIQEINWAEVGTHIWNAIVNIFTTVGETMKALFESAKTLIGQVEWAKLGSDIWNWIVSKFLSIGGWFQKRFEEAHNFITNIDWYAVGETVWNGIVSLVKDFANTLKAWATTAWYRIKNIKWADVGQVLWDGITGLVKDLGQGLWDIFSAAVDFLLGFTKWDKLGQAIFDGIKSKYLEIKLWLKNLWQDIIHPGANWTAEERAEKKKDTANVANDYLAKGGIMKKAYGLARMFTSPTVIPTTRGNMMFGDGVGGEIVLSEKMLSRIAGGEGVAEAISILTRSVDNLSDSLTEKMAVALNQMGFRIDGREFARLVRSV